MIFTIGMHFTMMILTVIMFPLVSLDASEAGISCDAGDAACSVDPASGSVLMQIGPGHSHKKDVVKHHGEDFSQLVHRAAPNGFCVGYPCHASLLSSPSSNPAASFAVGRLGREQERGQQGRTADLTESGYEKVAALKDDTEMKEFILRVIDEYDCKVESPGGLNGIVPWFSGATMVQSLAKLKVSLLHAILAEGRGSSWLSYKNTDHITGDTAEMSFVGYIQVAAMKNIEEMKNFVRRVCTDMGVKVVDEGGLEGMVKYESGKDKFQSYSKLKHEIKSAANAQHSWADFEKKDAPASKTDKFQYSAATQTYTPYSASEKKDVPASKVNEFQHSAATQTYTPYSAATQTLDTPISLLKIRGFSLLAMRASNGFCTGYPCRALVQAQPNNAQGTGPHALHGMGKRATLDQAGYAQVAALKDDSEMQDFIFRMIEKYDCKVEIFPGLWGIVPWFSGSTSMQDISKLEASLLHTLLTYTTNPWLTYRNSDHLTGDSAKLGTVGYVQVAAMRNDAEMKKFVRRVCNAMGVQIVDEGGFSGMVNFYSGTDNFESFDKLQNEVKSAANAPHSWANWINKPKRM